MGIYLEEKILCKEAIVKEKCLAEDFCFRRENNNDERNTLERKIFLRRIILIREEILCMGMYLKEENTLQRGTRKGKIH